MLSLPFPRWLSAMGQSLPLEAAQISSHTFHMDHFQKLWVEFFIFQISSSSLFVASLLHLFSAFISILRTPGIKVCPPR